MSSAALDDARLLALTQAYLEAEYWWERTGRKFALRIGGFVHDLEKAYPTAREFCLLSAWNPHSIERDVASNQDADAQLHASLRESGIQVQRAHARASDQSWLESGWLAAGLSRTGLDALSRRYGQLGSLYCRRGESLRLRMYHARPDEAVKEGAEHIDWVPPTS